MAIRDPMAEIILLWRVLSGVVENVWRKLLQLATLFGGREHYGDGCVFAKALNWRLHLAARTMRRRSLSAKRANREAESGLRCSSVVR